MSFSNVHNSRPLSLESFRIIRSLVNRRFGIFFNDSDRNLLESRLAGRVMDLEFQSFEEYAEYLSKSASMQELDNSVELLTNNETYFFREDNQLGAFFNQILPGLHRKNERMRQLTIWSAGCSSGEEVYSIAIFIEESGLFSGWDVRIFGSDISGRMLARARSGVFGKSAFRNTPEYLRTRYFRRVGEGSEWEVKRGIREKCSFGKMNLLDSNQTGVLGTFDVIFCRNVLIYFDRESRMQAVDLFHRRLNRTGYLLLGHSESLLNRETPFIQVDLNDTAVYQKQEEDVVQ